MARGMPSVRSPWLLALAAATALGSCVPSSVITTNTALERAPYDLDCPAEQITADEIANNTVRAVGCGRAAIYNCRCSFGVGLQCTEYNCAKESSQEVRTGGATPQGHSGSDRSEPHGAASDTPAER
jgi:hypothetical protein